MFRFTIREVLVLTLAAGLAVGWWLDRRQQAAQLAEASQWRTIAGGLEHIVRQQGWRAGIENGRIWAASDSASPTQVFEVGADEFEPRIGTARQSGKPLSSYYDDWIYGGRRQPVPSP